MLHTNNIYNIMIENNDHNEILRDISERFWDLFDVVLRDEHGINDASYDVLCGIGTRINPLVLAEKKGAIHCSIDNRYYINQESIANSHSYV